MDALNYLGYDPNKELPIVTKIKSDVKKLNDKQLIISKIKDMETKLNFEYEKKRLIWSESDEAEANADKKSASKKSSKTVIEAPLVPEIFEPTKVKLSSSNIHENIEKISQFLQDVNDNRISKNNKSPQKAKSATSNFLSKLVLDKSDFLTSSVKSLNSISDMPSLEDFSSINKLDVKKHSTENAGYIDDDNDETNSIYYDEFLGLPASQHHPHHNSVNNKQINSDHLRSIQRSNATSHTISSLKIDTILEES